MMEEKNKKPIDWAVLTFHQTDLLREEVSRNIKRTETLCNRILLLLSIQGVAIIILNLTVVMLMK